MTIPSHHVFGVAEGSQGYRTARCRLQEYKFWLRYRTGKENAAADCLSRMPERLQIASEGHLIHETFPEVIGMVSGLLFVEDSVVLMAKDQRDDLGCIIECIQRKGNNLDRRD